jgi:hypothetical protein
VGVFPDWGVGFEQNKSWIGKPRRTVYSEGQVLLPKVRGWRLAELGRAPGSFHGQGEDKQSLIEMAVMQLGSVSQDFSDDPVSDVKFIENREWRWHREEIGVGCLWWRREPSDLAAAELVFELVELIQSVLAAALLCRWGKAGANLKRGCRRWCWGQPNTADVEVFLETVELEEVG